jgi:hypothetical protein
MVLVGHHSRLLAQGKARRFADVRVAFEAGRKAVSAQRHGVRTLVTEGRILRQDNDDCFQPF